MRKHFEIVLRFFVKIFPLLSIFLLRRLLDGKIKAIAKKNIVQAKKFSEMLEASVIQYEKRSLATCKIKLLSKTSSEDFINRV